MIRAKTTFPGVSLCRLETVAARLRGSGATAPVSSGSQAGVGAGDGHAARGPALPQQLWVKVGVALGVFAEMVGAHKSFIADWTDKVFLSCVGSDMSGQLI